MLSAALRVGYVPFVTKNDANNRCEKVKYITFLSRKQVANRPWFRPAARKEPI